MIHPLLKTLASEPDLLMEHAGGYLQLVSAEAQCWGQGLQRRAWLASGVALTALLGGLLAGVALLLWAVTPPADIQQPWLLWSVPLLPLLLAAAGAWRLNRQPPLPAFELLRQQLHLDHQLLAVRKPAEQGD